MAIGGAHADVVSAHERRRRRDIHLAGRGVDLDVSRQRYGERCVRKRLADVADHVARVGIRGAERGVIDLRELRVRVGNVRNRVRDRGEHGRVVHNQVEVRARRQPVGIGHRDRDWEAAHLRAGRDRNGRRRGHGRRRIGIAVEEDARRQAGVGSRLERQLVGGLGVIDAERVADLAVRHRHQVGNGADGRRRVGREEDRTAENVAGVFAVDRIAVLVHQVAAEVGDKWPDLDLVVAARGLRRDGNEEDVVRIESARRRRGDVLHRENRDRLVVGPEERHVARTEGGGVHQAIEDHAEADQVGAGVGRYRLDAEHFRPAGEIDQEL